MSSTDNVKAGLMLAAAAGGAFLVWKLTRVGAGILSGDNALTNNAKDAQGNVVDAYKGVPIVGTLGAAANEVSGGWFASAGGWLGRTVYDLTHSDPDPTAPVKVAPPVNTAIMDRWDYYTLGGRGAGSGSGSEAERSLSFEDLSKPGGNYWDTYP